LIPEDNWTLKEYGDPTSGERSIFRKNLSPGVIPGSTSHPYVCYLTFGFSPRDSTGLSSTEVEDQLVEIEEREIPTLEAQELSVLVGVVLKGGVKDFIFYTRNPDEFLARAEAIREGHPEFIMGCEVGPNPTWSHYTDFP
jgi:hypothetical protein